MTGLKFDNIEKESWEQQKHKGEQIIQTILLQADFFEMKNRVKPTIFMSYDLFALVVAATKDLVTYRLEENRPINTICGYDLELIHHGQDLLYVGYKVLL